MTSTPTDLLRAIRAGLRWRRHWYADRIGSLLGVSSQHWVRVEMDRATAARLREIDIGNMDALEVSGSKWQSFGFNSYQSVHFPAFDLCEAMIGGAVFDIVIAEQVLEHVPWPYRAVKNVFAMLRPGGWFVVTTPFLLRVHPYPHDYTRWTEDGLRYLLAEGGFDLDRIQTGSWGNRACIKANFTRWARWVPWLHSLRNEPDFPAVVWAFAQKPGAYSE